MEDANSVDWKWLSTSRLLEQIALEKDWLIDNDKGVIVGKRKGYVFSLDIDDSMPSEITLKVALGGKINDNKVLEEALNIMQQQLRVKHFKFDTEEKDCTIVFDATHKKACKAVIEEAITTLSLLFEKLGVEKHDACQICNTKKGVEAYFIITTPKFLCANCKNEIEEAYKEPNAVYQEEPKRYMMGALFAFVLAFGGAAIWIKLHLWAEITPIYQGMFIPPLAMLGYFILGKTGSKTRQLLWKIAVVNILFASCWVLTEHLPIGVEITALFDYIQENPEFQKHILGDILFTFFSLLLAWVTLRETISYQKQPFAVYLAKKVEKSRWKRWLQRLRLYESE